MIERLEEYEFSAKVWKYDGSAGWYFVSAPNQISKNIRINHGDSEEGWGRLKAQIRINDTLWNTSIWFDSKHDCYLVPLKADVRKKAGIAEGNQVTIQLVLEF